MSKFKQTLNELYLAGYINDARAANSFAKQYDNADAEKQAAYDKHALLIIEKLASHNQNQRNNIASIKKNLQFIAWLFIMSLVAAVLVGLDEML